MVLASYPGGRRFNTPAGREKMPRPRENFRDLPLLAIRTPRGRNSYSSWGTRNIYYGKSLRKICLCRIRAGYICYLDPGPR
jgi:hypothetical protein